MRATRRLRSDRAGKTQVYTTSSALLEALAEAGVECLFANFGSDHTAIIEAIAAAREERRPLPRVLTVPAEMVAMSAAHGHAQLSGCAQAVLVRRRVRYAIAGRRGPQRGERSRAGPGICGTLAGDAGGRTARQPQRVHPVDPGRRRPARHRARLHELRPRDPIRRQCQADRASLRCRSHTATRAVRCTWCASGKCSRPRRRVWSDRPQHWRAVSPAALPAEAVVDIARSLIAARRPLVVTSFVGRNRAAVAALAALPATLR